MLQAGGSGWAWKIDSKAASIGVPDSVKESMGLDLNSDAFHDAAVDVLYLHHVFFALRNGLWALSSSVQSQMLRLLPREECILSDLLSTRDPASRRASAYSRPSRRNPRN